jgi:hypothetical protein
MVTVYVGSSEAYSGKTLTCIVLGMRWQRQGRRVGYLRPLGVMPVRVGDQLADEDAVFVARQLNLQAPPSQLCPILLGPDMCHADPAALRQRLLEAFAAAAEGREVVLLNGTGSVLTRGSMVGLDGCTVLELLDARAVLVSRCASFLDVDGILAADECLGERLAGVILNRVPAAHRDQIEANVVPCLQRKGIRVLGMLPEDPVLHSVTVRELAEVTGGQILSGEEAAEELVENFVVGAMSVEGALRYFRQTPRKCVITGGDRSDIQLAALETPTRCLILTGGMWPSHVVLARAEEQSVPVLLVPTDTLSTVATIDELLGKLRVRESAKIAHATRQFETFLDLAGLDAALGLA